GTVLFAAADILDNGILEWVAVYDGVLKGDFTFAQNINADSLADQLVHFPFQNVLARGVRVLVDKYPQSKPIAVSRRPFRMPDATKFEQVVANFWINATR